MKYKKTAIVFGITGQDGAYLSKFLIKKGYTVYGTARRGASEKFARLEYLNIKNKINIIDFDLLELSNIQKLIRDLNQNKAYS